MTMRFLLLIVLLSACHGIQALTIEEAYKRIPHRQTTFLRQQSRLPQQEATYVAELLSLAEQAMLERVRTMQTLSGSETYETNIVGVLDQLRNLSPPEKLKPVQQLILQAIEQHRDYFRLSPDRHAQERKQLIQQSHRALIQAYNTLMHLYPDETPHNRQAFYDYLCALDFI